MNGASILIVDRDPHWRGVVSERLARERVRVAELSDLTAVAATFHNGIYAAVIIGAAPHDEAAVIAAAAAIRALDRRVPLILIADTESESLAVAALRSGMADYLRRPVAVDAVAACVRRCLADRGSRDTGPQRASSSSSIDPESMLGDTPHIRQIKAFIGRVALTDSNVLITGETGTGKELAAELIHRGSPRRARPFISINCAAIPDGLLESELFGYETGAFTGAHATKEGQLQLAAGGTVFFDEIGDMGGYAQAKILRAIEGKPLYRLGGRRSIPLDIRVVAATNQDLDKAMADGRFRKDLYYRLNVARIHLPPLRDRKADIPQLLAECVTRLNRRFGRAITGFTPSALQRLVDYDWPGNIRELRNLVEAVFINLPDGPPGLVDVPGDFRAQPCEVRPRAVEREQILSVLSATNWNKSKAAEKLHWSRMTLYRKMAKYHLVKSGSVVSPDDCHTAPYAETEVDTLV